MDERVRCAYCKGEPAVETWGRKGKSAGGRSVKNRSGSEEENKAPRGQRSGPFIKAKKKRETVRRGWGFFFGVGGGV